MAIELLDVIPNAAKFSAVDNGWTWKLNPRAQVFAALTNTGYLFHVAMLDHFDEELARSTLLHGLEHEADVVGAEATLLPDFHCTSYEFESVVAFSSKIHNVFASDHPDLHPSTFVLFPTYPCEFTGDETTELLHWINRNLPRVDIKRKPWPQVMCYETDDRGNLAKAPIKPDSLTAAVLGLKWRRPGDVLQIENFRRQSFSIRLVDSRYHIVVGNSEEVVEEGEILPLLNRIVVDGEVW